MTKVTMGECPRCKQGGTRVLWDGVCTVCHTNAARVPRLAAACPGCVPGNPVPHEPSRRCKSGRRPHCTCDTCF